MKRLIIGIILAAKLTAASAATNTAASLSFANVNSAMALCSDGDTLQLPAGSATWGSSDVLNITAAINMAGAGTNSTRIIGAKDPFIHADVPGKGYQIHDLTLDCGGITSSGFGLVKLLRGYAAIYNVVFTNGGVKLGTENSVGGVVWNCTFWGGGNTDIFITNPAWDGIGDYGDWSWATNSTLGTTQQLVFENCFFTNTTDTPFIDAVQGARYTIRTNIILRGFAAGHGADSSGRSRGQRQCEWYNNVQSTTGDPGNEYRGGILVAVSNIVSGLSAIGVLKCFRAEPTDEHSAPFNTYPNGWDCGTNAIDMPGLGKGDYLSGASPTPVCLNQAIEGCYSASNKVGASLINFSAYAIVVNGTHRFDNAFPPGWSPLTYPHPLRTAIEGSGGGGGNPPITYTSGDPRRKKAIQMRR